jgi:hypothetical protein
MASFISLSPGGGEGKGEGKGDIIFTPTLILPDSAELVAGHHKGEEILGMPRGLPREGSLRFHLSLQWMRIV